MEDDKFERAQGALTSLAQRQDYDQRNRLALLAVHGWAALVIGLLIVVEGGPTAWVEKYGTRHDWALAAPAIVGGVLLLVGLTNGRAIRLEAAGMTFILAWDLYMVWLLGSAGVVGPTALYPVAVYGCLAALMVVHLRTLYAYAKKPRA